MTAVITGLGVVSGFGDGCGALLDGLRSGRSAVGPIRRFDASTFEARVAAEGNGDGPDPKAPMAVRAAQEAVPDGLEAAWVHLGLGLAVANLERFRKSGFRTEVDAAAWSVRDALGLTGPVTVDVSACAAGGLALVTAAQLVEAGLAEAVVCGGADAMVNPLGLGGMARLGATSAKGVCRPFDRNRDGLVMGEGAAVFVVESERSAKAGGRRIRARILGTGSTQDGYAATAPRPDGSRAAAAMRAALGGGTVDWVNAHGTGTPLNDAAELAALRAVGLGGVPIRSLKGALGHGMAAAGALEAAATVLCLEHDLLPGTVGMERPMDGLVRAEPQSLRADRVLSVSFGFGGQNVALVLGR